MRVRGPGGRCPESDDERGSVTAEFALALPSVMVVLAVLLGVFHIGNERAALQSAARSAARELARGEDPETAAEAARRDAPTAQSAVTRAGDLVTVTVTEQIGEVFGVGGIRISAQATARSEDVHGDEAHDRVDEDIPGDQSGPGKKGGGRDGP